MANQMPVDDSHNGKPLEQGDDRILIDLDEFARFFQHYDILDHQILTAREPKVSGNGPGYGPSCEPLPSANETCTPEGFLTHNIKKEANNVPMTEGTTSWGTYSPFNISLPSVELSVLSNSHSHAALPQLANTFAPSQFQYHDNRFNPYNSTSDSSFNSTNASLTHLQGAPISDYVMGSCGEIPTDLPNLDTPRFSQPFYGATSVDEYSEGQSGHGKNGDQRDYHDQRKYHKHTEYSDRTEYVDQTKSGNGGYNNRELMNFVSFPENPGLKYPTNININSLSAYKMPEPTATKPGHPGHDSDKNEKLDIVVHGDRSLWGWPFTGELPPIWDEVNAPSQLYHENTGFSATKALSPLKSPQTKSSPTRKRTKPVKLIHHRFVSTDFVTLSSSSVQCLGVILDYHGYKGRIYKKVINLNISNVAYALHDPTERRKLPGGIFKNTCRPQAIIEGRTPDEPSTQVLLVVSGALQRQVHFREIPDIINSVSCITYVKLAKFSINNPYEPQYYRYELDHEGNAIPESKCGLCAFCPVVKFKLFKNSSYLSHLTLEHGIFANGYVIPEVLYYGDYQYTRSCHDDKYRKAVQCPVCFELIEVSCWKNKSNPLLSYFRHFKKVHQNMIRSFNRSTVDPVDVRNRSYAG